MLTECGVCWSPDLDEILDMGEQPVAERYGSVERFPLVLVQCAQCGLIQLDGVPDPAVVFPQDHPYTTGSTPALVAHFRRLAVKLEAGLPPGDVVVDIGANDGTLLARYRADLERVAVEPTGQAQKCRDNGFTTYQEPFTAALAKRIRDDQDGPAKVITACNVLAHVPDVHDFIAGVGRLLAGDGVFVAEVHDAAAITEGLQYDAVYHEHARYFTLGPLAYLLGMHGLDVADAERVGTHGGSWRVYARKRPGALGNRASLAAAQLRMLLREAARDGAVYGVGATTRATPLIHYAGVAEYLSCVCEVAGSEKIGLTIPGTIIPVVDEKTLIRDQPPHALLLSWHWADSIIPALRAKGYRGRFILPLPEPVIADG